MSDKLNRIAVAAVAGFCAAWLTGTAHGQVAIGEPVPEIYIVRGGDEFKTEKDEDAQPLLEQYRRRIVVMTFFSKEDVGLDDLLDSLVKIDEEYHDRGVVILPFIRDIKDEVDDWIKSKELPFEQYFYGIGFHFVYQAPSTPHIYLLDTSGVLRDRFYPREGWESRLMDLIRRDPPAAWDTARLQRQLSMARSHFNQGDLGTAYTVAKDIESLLGEEDELGRDAGKLVEDVEEKIKDVLEDARKAALEEKYDAAIPVLAEISVRFQKTEPAELADKDLARMMADRDLKVRINRAKMNVRGAMLNEHAAELAASERFVQAINVYRKVPEEYPDTEAAEVALEAIDQLNRDPAARSKIKQQRAELEADRWLDLGRRFEDIELHASAREYYEKIRKQHPETRAAEEARRRLAELPEVAEDGKDTPGDDA